MSKKFFITMVMILIAIGGGLWYWLQQYDGEIMGSKRVMLDQPIIRWQEVTLTESGQNIAMYLHTPRIIISNHYRISHAVNQAITRRLESLKDDFISAVRTAAEDNGDTNILNVDTQILLVIPELISFAFTTTEHLAGVHDNEPERTFLIFDLVTGKLIMEGDELFRDDRAWSRAVTMMKNYLLVDYQGNPHCDLLFAPQHHGFAASCIGVDGSRGGKHVSITGDISMSMIQEFLAPSVLSAIIQK